MDVPTNGRTAADVRSDLARKLSAHGDWGVTLAEDLTADAAFLRKLKPSLILARARGNAPKNGQPPSGERPTAVTPPPKTPGSGGPNPIVIVGAALVVGVLLAKVIDWRGHAHPRD